CMGAKARFAAAIAAASLLIPVAPGTASSAACAGRHVSTRVATFTVETTWNKKVYKRGETVKVDVLVTRPGRDDPAGLGIPLDMPQRLPAEGVTVTTVLLVNPPYYPFDQGVTGSDGTVTFKIKLPKNVKGEVDVVTHAKLVHNQGGPACSEVIEEEFLPEYPAFKVIP
ncbi:MAG: hypothetical protein ACLGHL_10690, partial [Actinomycetota bacterium]